MAILARLSLPEDHLDNFFVDFNYNVLLPCIPNGERSSTEISNKETGLCGHFLRQKKKINQDLIISVEFCNLFRSQS